MSAKDRLKRAARPVEGDLQQAVVTLRSRGPEGVANREPTPASLLLLALQLEKPMTPSEIKHLYEIALRQSNDPVKARRMLEAYLAGRDRLLPRKDKQPCGTQ